MISDRDHGLVAIHEGVAATRERLSVDSVGGSDLIRPRLEG